MKFFISTCAALALALSATVTTTTAASVATHEDRNLQQLGISAMARELLKAVNIARASKSVAPLCLNVKLTTASQVIAVDMAAGGWVGTTGTTGSTPTSRATDQGFNTTGVAELVGAGYANATHAVSEWMKSTDYNQYLLGEYEFLGAGYAFNAAQTYKSFWSLDFSKGGRGEVCSQ